MSGKKTTAEDISGAMGRLDDELIISADKKRIFAVTAKNKKGGNIMATTIISVAACAAAIGLAVALNSANISDSQITESIETTLSSVTALTGTTAANDPVTYAETLAEAKYPVMAKHPDYDDFKLDEGKWNDGEIFPDYDEEGYNKAYHKWSEDDSERLGELKVLDRDKLKAFYKKSANEFLSENNGSNAVYSPANVYIAAAMLAEVTDGNSRAQILDLLGSSDIEDTRGQAGALWRLLYREDGAAHTLLANSMWLNEDINFNQDTVNRLAADYYASSYRGDVTAEGMTKALQGWLNEQTGGLLEDYVRDIKLDPETIMALCSTVYFRGKWESDFNPDMNDAKIFHSPDGDVETEFMNKPSIDRACYFGEDFRAMWLDFTDRSKMWLILPDEDKTVEDVLAAGAYMDLVSYSYSGDKIKDKFLEINFSVPKFDVSSDIDLSEGLKALGVTDIFDTDKSDFSPLTEDTQVWLSRSEHAVRVKIDEEGCEAASYVVDIADGAGMPDDDKIDFILDRPFIFVITSDQNQPMFVGVVNDPV